VTEKVACSCFHSIKLSFRTERRDLLLRCTFGLHFSKARNTNLADDPLHLFESSQQKPPSLVRTHTRKLVLVLSLSTICFAQQSTPAPQQQNSSAPPASDQKPLTPAEKRKADLQADTEKLYRLTQELKTEVDKSNKDTLSVSVVKKAQEIERLAKSIKERSRQQ
jgi:hypothetical protein